jgi:hypothetical protein
VCQWARSRPCCPVLVSERAPIGNVDTKIGTRNHANVGAEEHQSAIGDEVPHHEGPLEMPEHRKVRHIAAKGIEGAVHLLGDGEDPTG